MVLRMVRKRVCDIFGTAGKVAPVRVTVEQLGTEPDAEPLVLFTETHDMGARAVKRAKHFAERGCRTPTKNEGETVDIPGQNVMPFTEEPPVETAPTS